MMSCEYKTTQFLPWERHSGLKAPEIILQLQKKKSETIVCVYSKDFALEGFTFRVGLLCFSWYGPDANQCGLYFMPQGRKMCWWEAQQ